MSTESEITAVLTRLAAAWTAADAPAYGAEFTRDATYVVFNGMVLRGRDAVVDTHAWLWNGPLKGSRMDPPQPGDLTVRVLRPDVAHVVQEVGGIALDGQEAAGDERASTVSFLFVRDGSAGTEDEPATASGWRIAAFQNTRRQT